MKTKDDKLSVLTEDEKTSEKFAAELPKKRVYCFFKRTFDIIISLLGLIILLVPLLILSLIIVIDSPGASPIYVQKRHGKNGKVFNFYKIPHCYHQPTNPINHNYP